MPAQVRSLDGSAVQIDPLKVQRGEQEANVDVHWLVQASQRTNALMTTNALSTASVRMGTGTQ